ncbi:hypothetical protein [Winslowiella toletana]|uniref:hypothetical protein n=1 Tax=Winslowiella toletana TaxID=92490 RepID=UPI000370AD50|nr:hypothetical protein [Winslowiella toletana]
MRMIRIYLCREKRRVVRTILLLIRASLYATSSSGLMKLILDVVFNEINHTRYSVFIFLKAQQCKALSDGLCDGDIFFRGVRHFLTGKKNPRQQGRDLSELQGQG